MDDTQETWCSSLNLTDSKHSFNAVWKIHSFVCCLVEEELTLFYLRIIGECLNSAEMGVQQGLVLAEPEGL